MSSSAHVPALHQVRPSNTQENQNIFSCPQCSKSFSRAENLKRHTASHEAAKFRCVVCDKHFTRSDLLKRHRKNHEKRTSIPPRSNQVQSQDRAPDFESVSKRFVPITGTVGGFDGEERLDATQDSQPGLQFDNFMTNDDMSGLNLGSFDADIAWTLDFGHSHPFIDAFPVDYLTPSSAGAPVIDSGDALELVEDEAGEWPDRISRPASPKRRRPQRPHQVSRDWSATIAEAQLAKSQHQPDDVYAWSIDQGIRENLVNLLRLPTASQISDGDRYIDSFPQTEVLEYYLLLYFRHIHERFPVIHLPTFNLWKTSPFLLMALLLAGSNHSRADKGWFTKIFYKHCRLILMYKVEADSRFLRSADNIFVLLLICVAGTWSGGRQSYEFAEGFRGVLVTASRRCRLLDCRPSTGQNETYKGSRILDQIWHSWIESEKQKRLGLAIYLYDCQYPALFNNQPYISKSETANSVFPCPQEYWNAKTSDAWKMLIGPANMPPSTFYIHALNSCLVTADVPTPQRVDDFGKTVLLYALHTHIFEWRQAISMLNPNGFANTYGTFIFDIGVGLEERKQWLVDSLKNWHTCYDSLSLDPTVALLYHLGFVSLDVSLSDLHLAAGRSGNRVDGEIAERSLRTWANSESATVTMWHVHQGFEITYAALQSGAALHSSFEIIMSLFTGGLVSWAYSKFRLGGPQEVCLEHVRRAGVTLRELSSWRISSLFGVILQDFENV